MKNTSIIILVVLLIVVIGAIWYLNANSDSAADDSGEINDVEDEDSNNFNEVGENIVEITSAGFSPSSLEINKGETVTFLNKDSGRRWPATDAHPTHRLYPGSDKSKCETAERTQIFDACRGLEEGESYSFTFNELGEWGYHDHLNPELTGKIIVR